MLNIKTPEEIEIMREAGQIASHVLDQLVQNVLPGRTTADLDQLAEKLIKESGGEPGFKKVPNYYHTICTAVNEDVVHGIPGERKLNSGDIISIDLGVFYRGFHSDCATTVGVGEIGDSEKKFLAVGKRALQAGIEEARAGNHVGDIGCAIETVLRGEGYGIVAGLTGHGVGHKLHEEPLIPNFGEKGQGHPLTSGMVIAIEPIYTTGSPEVYLKDDGWTVTSSKGNLAGHFEDTVAITGEGPIILTDSVSSPSTQSEQDK